MSWQMQFVHNRRWIFSCAAVPVSCPSNDVDSARFLSERTNTDGLQQALDLFHRQAYDVGEGAFDAFDEFVAGFLDAVGAGFAVPVTGGDVVGDLLFGEGARVDDGGLCFDDFDAFGDTGQSDPGDDVVGFAEQLACDLFGVGGVVGFADDFTVQIDDGVGAEDERVGESLCDVAGFGQGEAIAERLGIEAVGFKGFLVHRGWNDFKAVAGVLEERLSAR